MTHQAHSLSAVVEGLSEDHLISLLYGETLAIRIPHFIPPETCQQWKQDLEQSVGMGRYLNAEDVHILRSGMTLFETESEAHKLEAYFSSAEQTHPNIEQMLSEGNPLKMLQERISQTWSEGCEVNTYRGNRMNPGILRAFEAHPDGGLPPHIDSLLKDLPNDPSLRDLKCQLAANLYIWTGESGGSLEVWDYMPTDAELPFLFNGHHDFIERELLPSEPVVIQPRMGELILFRSTCVHSVQPIQAGIRIAAASFVGFYGEEHPLKMWI